MGTDKDVSLTRAARNILMGCLQGPGWYGSPKYAYLAGEILAKVLPEWEDAPEQVRKDPKEMAKWLSESFPHIFSVQQFKACKACLTHFLEQKEEKGGRLQPSKWLFELMTAFDLAPKEDAEG